MVCIEIFTDENSSREKSKHLAQDYDKALELEKISVSSFSPRVVENCEPLARQIFSPIHIDVDTNEIKTGAFDDVLNKGMSSNRLCLESEEIVHSYGEAKAEKDKQQKPDRNYHGFITAGAGKIRECVVGLHDKKQIFAIYDTSLENMISHADICAVSSPQFTKSQKIEIKRLLQKTFSCLKCK